VTWKKLSIGAAMAFTGKNAAATAVAVGGAAIGAAAIGQNPILWGLGAFGGAVVYAYKSASGGEKKPVALANFCISVLIGGFAAPSLAQQISTYAEASGEKAGFFPFMLSLGSSEYLLALSLPIIWPVAVPFLWSQVQRLVGGAKSA
jgi:hypothetical protein